jgi:hypothetical protein
LVVTKKCGPLEEPTSTNDLAAAPAA